MELTNPDTITILSAQVCYMAAMGSERKREQLLGKIDARWLPDPQLSRIFADMQRAPADETLVMYIASVIETPAMQQAMREQEVTASAAAKMLKEAYISRGKQTFLQALATSTSSEQDKKIIDKYRQFVDDTGADDRVEIVDMTRRSPSIEYTLTLGDIAFAPRREICAIKGRAKHGKTHLVAIMLAAMLASGPVCGMERAVDNLRVLYVDTEQSKWSSEHIVETSLRMAGLPTDVNCPRLTCINLRKTGKQRRKQVIEGYVASGQFDVVIVDGIKDLCLDFNDLREADQLMVDVLAMVETYNIAYITVLHENPSGESSKMRGHLGTEVENKSFEVFQSKKSESDVFNITNTERRAKPLPTFAFKFDEYDQLVACAPDEVAGQSQGQKAEDKKEKDWRQFIKAWDKMGLDVSLTKEDIIKEHLRMGTIKEGTTKNRIKSYYESGRLMADGDVSQKGTRYFISTEERLKLREQEILEEPDEPKLPF